eukprot:2064874-Ditylum_brightwellii.AAC.1
MKIVGTSIITGDGIESHGYDSNFGTSTITYDGIESHGYDSNFGSDSDPQDEEDNTFDMEKKKNIPTTSWMI